MANYITERMQRLAGIFEEQNQQKELAMQKAEQKYGQKPKMVFGDWTVKDKQGNDITLDLKGANFVERQREQPEEQPVEEPQEPEQAPEQAPDRQPGEETLEMRTEYLKNKYGLDDEQMEQVFKTDPTETKRHAGWIAKQFRNINDDENLPTVGNHILYKHKTDPPSGLSDALEKYNENEHGKLNDHDYNSIRNAANPVEHSGIKIPANVADVIYHIGMSQRYRKSTYGYDPETAMLAIQNIAYDRDANILAELTEHVGDYPYALHEIGLITPIPRSGKLTQLLHQLEPENFTRSGFSYKGFKNQLVGNVSDEVIEELKPLVQTYIDEHKKLQSQTLNKLQWQLSQCPILLGEIFLEDNPGVITTKERKLKEIAQYLYDLGYKAKDNSQWNKKMLEYILDDNDNPIPYEKQDGFSEKEAQTTEAVEKSVPINYDEHRSATERWEGSELISYDGDEAVYTYGPNNEKWKVKIDDYNQKELKDLFDDSFIGMYDKNRKGGNYFKFFDKLDGDHEKVED